MRTTLLKKTANFVRQFTSKSPSFCTQFVFRASVILLKGKSYSDPVTGPVWSRGWVKVQLYSSITATLEGGEWSAALPGRTLPPGKTRYPLYRRLGGRQGRSGRAENLVFTGIRSRIVQPVAQSLYRLSYRAHKCYIINLTK
jgi:hypothetical protein